MFPVNFVLMSVAIVFFNLQSDDSLKNASKAWRVSKRCGPNTAYLLLRILNIEIEYEDVLDSLKESPRGTSIRELTEFLKLSGANVSASKATPENLGLMQVPFIAYLEPVGGIDDAIGHFVVVYSVEDHYVEYVDGTTAAIVRLSFESFVKGWGGIIISRQDSVFVRYGWIILSAGIVVILHQLRIDNFILIISQASRCLNRQI